MDLAEQAEALPREPGVYLFKDARGEVLYVGKARDLYARVRQYLQGHDERFMVRYLVAASQSVHVVPTHSEKEALLLENSLIKQHQPRYNAKLRDDKGFLHIRLDARQEWPRLTTVRQPADDGARYFGPYHAATSARRTLQYIGRHFPLRTCTDAVLHSRKRPCLLHQLGRCAAPCVGLISAAAYDEIVSDTALALAGRNTELVPRVRAQMAAAAEAERFEEAARLRDLATTLETALQRQVVADTRRVDRDAWNLYREADRGVAAILPVREGLAREPATLRFEGEILADAELVSKLLNTWYDTGEVPPEILVPAMPPDRVALEEVLGERRGSRVRVHAPERGDKAALVELAGKAARARFQVTHAESDRIARALQGLAEIAGLATPPYRVECFDNSNLLGQDPVASQVVFLDGRPAKKEYRRYQVKTVTGADDYATMREILARRLRRAAEEGAFPDLVIVDGGRGQLSAAEDVLAELGMLDQAVIGVAKPRTERRRGERDAVDKIIVRGRAEPVLLRADDPTLRLVQQIRDEAHRTAIGYHRERRIAREMRSVLDDIPGIAKGRRKALLVHFGSLAAVRAASVEEIAAVPGIGRVLAQTIVEALGRDDRGP